MIFFNKHFLYLIVTIFILSGCKLQEPNKSHGIIYLENRAKTLVLNTTNKNDVIGQIGRPQIIDESDQNNWIYIERVLTKGKFHNLGKNILKENNVLVSNFDKYGILTNKKFLNKEDINQIKFSKRNTENELSQKNFIRSFLESIRQKMYSNKK